MRRSLCHTFCARLLHFASLFSAFIASLQQSTKKIWKVARMMRFYLSVFYSLKRYTCRAMCTGGRDEIMEKRGVGHFIVAFAEWGALSLPGHQQGPLKKSPVYSNSSLTGMTSTGNKVLARLTIVCTTSSAQGWFSGNAVLVRMFHLLQFHRR